MFDLINRFAHGVVAVPVIRACERRGLFSALADRGPLTPEELMAATGANEGYLHVALRLLESLGWLDAQGRRLTFGPALELGRVPDDIEDLYRIPLAETLRASGAKWPYGKWVALSRMRWNGTSALMSDLLDGAVVLPILLELHALPPGGAPFAALEEPVRSEVLALFMERGWATLENGSAALTDAGRMLLEQSMIGGSTVSYKPMLAQMQELIFGDHRAVFSRTADHAEEHVDRSLNVRASGFQHQKYFREIQKIVLEIFDREPLEAQPRYLMDTGCGDGSLLRSLYDGIVARTLRGRSLDRHPLTLIGVDYNAHARKEASRTLTGTPYLMLFGDIADPQGIARALNDQGIVDFGQILHIRSFLDHDRPFREPLDASAERAIPTRAVSVDQDGNRISPERATSSLTDFLRGWSGLIDHGGIVIAEVHAVEAVTARRFIDECESLHYDAFHGFSRQHLVEPEVFLLAAGRVGLFPRAGSSRRYPREFPYTRITIHHFEKRPYRIRNAKPDDLPALIEIDRQCWPPALCTPASEFHRRVDTFPDEQFVVEQDGQVIGVCYTQPIAGLESLRAARCESLHAYRLDSGDTLQLLGLNVLPSKRASGLGDQLLEFVLEYARCCNRVNRVVGVSRCSAYDPSASTEGLESYMRRRGGGGQLVDPVLSFHESHGAEIVGLVPQFRPEDSANQGCGVLIHYDLNPGSKPAVRSDLESGRTGSANLHAVIEGFVRAALQEDESTRAPKRSRQQPFMEMGLESMQLLKLRALLSDYIGEPLDSAFLFRYSTIDAVAAALRSKLDASTAERAADVLPSPVVPAPAAVPALAAPAYSVADAPAVAGVRGAPSPDLADAAALPGFEEPQGPDAVCDVAYDPSDIAVVGVACRFPGGGPQGFWQLLRDGVDGVREVPPNRWWWPPSDESSRRFEQAGYIDDIDTFDAALFRIAPVEAELIDPQQRVLLELAWEVFEDAGHSCKSQRGSATGVWIGCCHFDYRDLLVAQQTAASGHTATGTFGSILANRLSYFFDFKGPSVTIDTACSSTLVALHSAVQSLRRGECEQAIIGGVNLICTPTNTKSFARAGMLSPTGRCHTFDREADGYARGEGAGLVLLKPLGRALADGDQIYGIIAGSAVNHGGEANSLTAPSPQAQRDVIMGAYQDAGLSPVDVDYVEAHGTGTPLGDPIELAALKEAFESLLARSERRPAPGWICGVGSAKSNIGHLEGAAGIAGLIKILLSIRHRTLPGNLHFNSLNPHINLDESPFRIVAATRPWARSSAHRPRCAGVSSFGFGGVSAHVLVREYTGSRSSTASTGSQIIPISAATEQQLRESCTRLLGFLQDEPESGPSALRLEDVAWTLQVGRASMEERLALVASSLEDLKSKLRCFLDGVQDVDICRARAEGCAADESIFSGFEGREFIRIAIERRKLNKVARLWTQGEPIDWSNLHTGYRPLRISLPSYPFAKERYWIPQGAGVLAAGTRLHALLHENTSDLREQSYRTGLSGEEFYLSDHRVVLGGEECKVLPAVVYLEMARAGIERASGAPEAGRELELSETVWLQPLVVREARQVSVALGEEQSGAIEYQIYSAGAGGEEVVHCEGRGQFKAAQGAVRIEIEALRGRCTVGRVSGEELYERLARMGLRYGAGHRAVQWVERGAGELCGRLELPAGVAAGFEQYVLHPSLMDGALQACLGLMEESAAGGARLPYALESVRVVRAGAPRMWVWARERESSASAVKLDVDVCDEQGELCVQLRGLTARALREEPPVARASSAPGAEPQEASVRREGAAEGARTSAAPDAEVTAGVTLLERTQEYLRRELSGLLHLAAHRIDVEAPLESYGMDSILAMNFTRQLEKSFGTLSKTLLFEYRSLQELGGYLLEAHGETLKELFATAGLSEGPAVAGPVSEGVRGRRRRVGGGRGRGAVPGAVSQEGIAIIGLSGRYPQAQDLEEYWRNLRSGKDCITQVPAERWDWREYYSEDRSAEGRHFSKWGGFIAGVDEFDPLFFNISPREAQLLDPQERLFLQHAWMAVEDAGYTRTSLQEPHEQDLAGQVGVYVGVMYSEYQLYGAQALAQGRRLSIAGSFASIANRVSYVLNLHGPSMTLDTMCSSSLTAIHVACQDLRQGRTSVAIAGGVNVSIHPSKYLMLSAGQFISSTGQCQSFGEGGDGYIPGEGVGAVVLKRLSEAEREGHPIYGVIRGSALTHGGKTNGYTVPNPQAQSSAIRRALREARVDARQISYIEAHGTGTKLGDPIEIAALSAAFGQHTQERGFCLIGSAKSNIGHCESAAGIAGLTKVLLQMKHGEVVPSLHASRLNPHIDFERTPFVVNQSLRAWEAPRIEGREVERLAGISSFGAGGSNAHMIVQEYRGRSPSAGKGRAVRAAGEAVLVPLSARTAGQLEQKVKDLLSFVARTPGIELADLAYTLQVGREGMDERLGVLAATLEELTVKLEGYVQGEAEAQVYRGQVKRTQEGMVLISQDEDMREAVQKWIARKKHAKLLELWVQGLEVPWGKLYGAQRPALISLPSYPFAKERYWIPQGAGVLAAGTRLHALLHENTSDLREQSYRTGLSGEEFYLSDHRVVLGGEECKVLPAVVYLEMARAGIERASGAPEAGRELELSETVWLQPLVVREARQVSVALGEEQSGAIEYQIYSAGAGGEEVVHCEGRGQFKAAQGAVRIEIEALRGRCTVGRVSGEELYERLARMGLRYGAGHRAVQWVERGAGELCGRLELPAGVAAGFEQYVLHPSLMDGALQACLGLMEESAAGGARLPYALESVRVVRAGAPRMWVWARERESSASAVKLDVDVCDEQGELCVQLRGLTARALREEPPVARASSAPGAEPQEASVRREGAAEGARTSAAPDAEVTAGVTLLERTQEYLRRELSGLLHLAAHRIDVEAPLESYGMDSILAMNFTRQLEKSFGTLSKTLLFEYRSLQELGGYLLEAHGETLKELFATAGLSEGPAVAGPVSEGVRGRRRRVGGGRGRGAVPGAVSQEGIAIIGLSGRYPQAQDLEEYWRNLRSGKDCITQVPAERWDWREYYSEDRSAEGRHFSKWGGFIAGVDEFDPLFFNISPREAQLLDPQERLFLQHAWMAVEDAGYTRTSLQEPHEQDLAGQVGVYVGVMYSEYQLYGAQALAQGRRLSIAGSFASIANRVSYVLNLHGPSMTLDTMCSSSLTAIHVACQDLRQGRTSVAIAGGVNVSIHPSKYLMLSAGQFISSTGQCQSFGEGGDGYIPGEGVGAVVLKRLSEAEREGHPIYGVIRGSALTHGGKTNGYTVPNPQAQSSAIRRALREARVDARQISYIEAHGTGTKLGDPIEIAALSAAFGQHTQERGFCLIGSAKSNIGHCESAAGIAGLTKVLLQMKHGEVVPSLHASRLNPHIDFERTPFVVNQSLRAWEAPRIEGREVERLAGISSFGAGGSNAHMIVQEYRGRSPSAGKGRAVRAAGEAVLVPLSARTAGQLEQKVKDLLSFVARTPGIELADLAYTLQVGREGMDERLGVLAATLEELTVKLEGYVQGEAEAQVYRGQVKRTQEGMVLISQDEDMREAVQKWIARKKHAKLLELWVQGLEVPWGKLYGAQRPALISLPSYPFAKERYWIPQGAGVLAAGTRLHALLHENTSDLREQSYRTGLSGEEFYLSDHRVVLGGEECKVLPAVVYLEMARAGIERASGAPEAGRELELSETVWLQPLVVREARQVSVALGEEQSGAIEYQIYSAGAGGEEVVHCEGRGQFKAAQGAVRIEIEALRGRCTVGRVSGEELYERLARMGLRYGAGHRAVQWVERGAGELCGRLELPAGVAAGFEQYVLHPSLMDGALQACLGLMEESAAGGARLPYALESVRVVRAGAPRMWVWARERESSASAVKLDVDVCDEQGELCVQLRGLTARALREEPPVARASSAPGAEPQEASGRHGVLLAVPVWQEREAPGAPLEPFEQRRILVCEMAHVHSERLASALPGSLCRCVRASGAREDVAGRYLEQAQVCFEQVREMLLSKPRGPVLLQVVAAASGPEQVSAGLWGLLQTAAQENPRFIGQVLLVEPSTSEEQLARLLKSEAGAGAGLIRHAGGRRAVRGWQEERFRGAEAAIGFKEGGVYLISGGMGGLGQLLAAQIVRQTRKGRVVLAGRGELTEPKRRALQELAGDAGRVQYRQVDVQEEGQVQELIEWVCREHGRLDGIVHSAGVIADNFILKKTAQEFGAVLGAKVRGTLNLDWASREVELDFLVLFSSVAGALGNVGQADYAAANGFMDAYAPYRNERVERGERHGRTVSINWPLWAEGGMRMEAASLEWLQQETGMRPLGTGSGMQALHGALEMPAGQVLVLEGDREQLRRRVGIAARTLSAPDAVSAPSAEPEEASVRREGAAEGARTSAEPVAEVTAGVTLLERTQEYLRRELSGLLHLAAHRIDVEAPLESYGMDSILAMNFTRQLEKSFGTLSKTLLFEYRSLNDLARYLVKAHPAAIQGLLPAGNETHALETRVSCEVAKPTSPVRGRRRFKSGSQRTQDIAIVGVGGKYPRANDLEEFWENLKGGTDCITEIPKDRWDFSLYHDADRNKLGKSYSKWGGFIADVDKFDPLFFGISPREAELIDPQERLFLEISWKTIEDAGYSKQSITGGRVGVFVGVMWAQYELLGVESALSGASPVPSSSHASIANRVSYVFDFHGPSIAIDTMCSSSLTAIHLACEAIRRGEIDAAIAGGVNLSVHPQKYVGLSQGKYLATDGRCKSFGEGGDGYVPGEGIGAVLLKPLEDALRDKDHIYAVVKSCAINHGGKTNGYTVPNPNAQAALITGALQRAAIDPRSVGYIETHGTGTSLGDPIEITGLTKAFEAVAGRNQICPIGSVKSNIGHLEAAAGIAAVTKVLLQMKHGQLVPSLHAKPANPLIDFAQSPFYVQTELAEWKRLGVQARRACVSSFGAGGSNAHLILEEYPDVAATEDSPHMPELFLLSARDPQSLERYAREMARFLTKRPGLSLANVAYTTQVGRTALDLRLAVIASSIDELKDKLAGWLANRGTTAGPAADAPVAGESAPELDRVFDGNAREARYQAGNLIGGRAGESFLTELLAARDLERLAKLWMFGVEIDWSALRRANGVRRASLPSYPFARERYWLKVQARTDRDRSVVLDTERRAGKHYRPRWTASPLASPQARLAPRGPLLLLDRSRDLFGALKTRSSADAYPVIVATPGESYQDLGEDVFVINPERAADFQRLLDTVESRYGVPTHVIHCCGGPCDLGSPEQLDRQLNSGVYSLLHLSQALMTRELRETVRIASLYCGDAPYAAPESAALAGFLRALVLENPKFAGKTVHVQKSADESAAPIEAMAALILDELGDAEWMGTAVHYERSRSGEPRYLRHVRQLTAHEPAQADVAYLPLKQQGVYVITGGLGGLGLIFGEYLARTCRARLVLVGRSELDAAQAPKLERLARLGAEVHYVRADVSHAGDVESVVREARARFAAINGVIHAAGVNRDAFILRKTRDEMSAVLGAKVQGAIHLDRATRTEPLDWFVLFSSAAAELGNVGQADYAYANHFLDFFAESRENRPVAADHPGKTLSIRWPLWEEGGMTLSQEEISRLEEQTGLCPLPTIEGIKAWEDLLRQDLVRQDLQRQDLVTSNAAGSLVLYGDSSKLESLLARLSAKAIHQPPRVDRADDRRALLDQTRDYLKSVIGTQIGLAPERMDAREPLAAYGIESVVIARCNAALERDLGPLPKTLFYEHETIEALAQYLMKDKQSALLQRLGESRAQTADAAAASIAPSVPSMASVPASIAALPPPTQRRAVEQGALLEQGAMLEARALLEQRAAPHEEAQGSEPVAIIGVHGRYPGSQDLREYWENLREGRDLIELVPSNRWNYEELFDADPEAAARGRIYCKWGGFLEDHDKFDPSFFNISSEEAAAMDPQERLFLQSVWAAIEDAGYTRESLKHRFPKGRNAAVGVFVGVTTNTYNLLRPEGQEDESTILPSTFAWSIANRVSYLFDFEGPSMPVDTACSSSLVAVHLACESLRRAECRLAVVGGVNLYLHPSKYQSMCRRRMLSRSGQCRSYGAGEEGFVPGEGIGTLILKPLRAAIEDRDSIYGVIRGSAFAHSGRSNGYSAPNPNSQASVIDETLRKAGTHPDTIGYVEGHGTGTRMGDSLEIAALNQAFRRQSHKEQFCPVGSVKANIGHSESAAGIAAITKVLLQMRHRQLAPLIHAEDVNPDIEFEKSPFYLQRSLVPWQSSSDHPRRALINAFGGGGVNACVVVEEFERAARAPAPQAPAPQAPAPQASASQASAPQGEFLFTLSAGSEPRLKEYAQRWLAFLEREPTVDLADLCYTLQVGREAMRERLAILVTGKVELAERLALWCESGAAGPRAYRGRLGADRPCADILAATQDGSERPALASIAQHWVDGARVSWELLYENGQPRRISMPTYPFARERYWVSDLPVPARRASAKSQGRQLHPLVSHNSSTLTGVSFSSRLSDTAFYATDHTVNQERIFPGAGFLEIAGVCGTLAAEQRVRRIRDVVWMHPLSFGEGPQVLRTHLKHIGDSVEYAITSFDDDHDQVVHSEGRLLFSNDDDEDVSPAEEGMQIEVLKERCGGLRTGEELYRGFATHGLEYGAGLQVVRELHAGDSRVLARMELPDQLKSGFGEFILHPALIDGALQAVGALFAAVTPHVLYLPFALDELELVHPLMQSCYAFAEAVQPTKQSGFRKFNIQLLSEKGDVLARLKHLHMMPLDEAVARHGVSALR